MSDIHPDYFQDRLIYGLSQNLAACAVDSDAYEDHILRYEVAVLEVIAELEQLCPPAQVLIKEDDATFTMHCTLCEKLGKTWTVKNAQPYLTARQCAEADKQHHRLLHAVQAPNASESFRRQAGYLLRYTTANSDKLTRPQAQGRT